MTSKKSQARVRPLSSDCCAQSNSEELVNAEGVTNVGEHEPDHEHNREELNVMDGSTAVAGGPGPEQDVHDEDLFAEEQETLCVPCEVRVPKTLYDPMLPSPKEVAEHNITHCPPRRWCKICVAGAGKEHPHLRDRDEEREGLPEYGMDYDHYGDVVETGAELQDVDDKVTNMVSKDRKTGMLWGSVAEAKGASDKWILRRQLQNIELLGRANVVCKTDGEPAIVQVQSKIIASRDGQTVPANPPAYNPESNGPIEKGVQDFNSMLRRLKLALEARIGCKVRVRSAVMEWLAQHAGFVHSRFTVGHDGKTPWERLGGRKWNRPMVEFGKRLWASWRASAWRKPKASPRTPQPKGPWPTAT